MEQRIRNFDASFGIGKAKNIGITTVLITCDDDNYGSARVMDINGFALRDIEPNVVNGKAITTRRYTKQI